MLDHNRNCVQRNMSGSSLDHWTQFHSVSGEASLTTPPPNQDDTGIMQVSSSTATTDVSSSSGSQLMPRGGLSKPLRRRSRASRRTPTTLLNADTANFRALVQQFTGCSTNPIPHKGPVTLNFGGQHNTTHQSNYNYIYNPSSISSSSSSSSPSVMAPVTYNIHPYNSLPPAAVAVALQQQQVHVLQDHHDQQQQYMYYSSSSSSSLLNRVDQSHHVFLSGDMERNLVGDDLSMDNLSCLHEILGTDSNFFTSQDFMS